MESSVSPKYQVTIPKEVREKLPNLKPYQKVYVIERDGEIIIKPKYTIKELAGILGKPPRSGKGMTFEEIRKEAYKKLKKV